LKCPPDIPNPQTCHNYFGRYQETVEKLEKGEEKDKEVDALESQLAALKDQVG
jgi:hypothetical protein